jgi:hypothetical protein
MAGVTKNIILGGQFGGWVPPPRGEQEERGAGRAGAIAASAGTRKRDRDDRDRDGSDDCSASSTSSKDSEEERATKKSRRKKNWKRKDHKKGKKQKKQKHKTHKHKKHTDSGRDGVAKPLSKVEQMKLDIDKRLQAHRERSGQSIAGLRAQWVGGDMAKVRAPQNMCASGLEG